MVAEPGSPAARGQEITARLIDSRIVERGSLRHSGSSMKTKARLGGLAILLLVSHAAVAFDPPGAPGTNTVRIAAAQAARRVIDFHLKPAEALAAVDKNLAELERIVDRAGEAKC